MAKKWTEAEARRTKEISEQIYNLEFAGEDKEFEEFYEVDEVEEIARYDLSGYGIWRDDVIVVCKRRFVYAQNWDENDNRVKKGKGVKGSIFYDAYLEWAGESLDENVLGYKTLADVTHAVELYIESVTNWRLKAKAEKEGANV